MKKFSVSIFVVLSLLALCGCVKNNHGENMTTQNMSANIITDAQDRFNINQALKTTAIGKEAVWTNPETKNSFIVRPVKEYDSQDNQKCRKAFVSINEGQKVFFVNSCNNDQE